jgi:hypothetical protein
MTEVEKGKRFGRSMSVMAYSSFLIRATSVLRAFWNGWGSKL